MMQISLLVIAWAVHHEKDGLGTLSLRQDPFQDGTPNCDDLVGVEERPLGLP